MLLVSFGLSLVMWLIGKFTQWAWNINKFSLW
jgi:hypothetical protein